MRREPRGVRRVCFVTGSRAEFGLMRKALAAIENHAGLELQLAVTGMHLDPAHGDGIQSIRQAGFTITRVIPWEHDSGRDRATAARSTGLATAALADAFSQIQPEVVLVVGDRVEAFAAATAAHVSGIPVAHVHGGDRAAGQVDDALRHAITKLAHVHFPATRQSAGRLRKLGEEPWRIHRAGSPGVEGIACEAATISVVGQHLGPLRPRHYALIVLHPVDAASALEAKRATLLAQAALSVPYEKIVIVHPNNDPGAAGIIQTWNELESGGGRFIIARDLPRPVFLGLLRDAAVLAGNSSSGIIEAASFGTPVIDIGDRQKGRERGANVVHVPYNAARLRIQMLRLWNSGRPMRYRKLNNYGGQDTGRKIAQVLASVKVDDRLLRKLISY